MCDDAALRALIARDKEETYAHGYVLVTHVVERARSKYPGVEITVQDECPTWWAIAIADKGRVLVRADLMWVYSRPRGRDAPLFERGAMSPHKRSMIENIVYARVKEMILQAPNK